MRKKWIIIGASLLVLIAAVWGGSAIYANVENGRALDELALSTPATTSAAPATAGAAATDAPATTADATDLAGTWTVADGSQAGYRVKEVLNGQDVTVVGRTTGVTGTATVEGTSLTAATVTVDMKNVTTDNSSRDGQFLGILKTSEFPTSTFTLTGPVDIGAISNGVATVQAPGELTVAGVTQKVTATLSAQVTADGVEVQGSIPVTFKDYGIDAPNLGFVKVENTGTIEMLLKLGR
ncbi:YceI family protein [Arthrobacter sp. HY1533]|uniref:YceI family protein n=1 Tax=Arthrobacter sp. HY1533 TaxID=2970919 RepID=UPI0022B9F408|nr:YceI family protein [Arthrobacter sp. HY1533]